MTGKPMAGKKLDDGWRYATCRIKVSTAEPRDCSPDCPHLFIAFKGRKKQRVCYLDVHSTENLMPPRKRKGKAGDENAEQAARRSEICLAKARWVARVLEREKMENLFRQIGI